jgi:sugar phosphate isomerase/epimerase
MALRLKLLATSAAILFFGNSMAQEIGLELYTFRNQIPKDIPGSFKMIKEMGFREIEGGGTYGMSMDDYKKLLASNGLTMISVGADFDKLDKDPQSVVENAKAFGAKYVVCFWIPHDGSNFTIDDTKRAVEVFSRAGKLLRENGFSFCYHMHGYEFRPYEGGTLFDYLIKNVSPQDVNFEMDVFWVKNPGQDPVALLKKYPNRFPLMHLKDRKPGTENNQNGTADDDSNVVLGTGDVGIAVIMKEAKRAGVKHYFIEDESSTSVQQVPLSLKFLKSLK